MTHHQFARDQEVTFHDIRVDGKAWSGAFVVTSQLPSGGQEPRYAIKSVLETFSRAAYEHQLSARGRSSPWSP